jgi:hypothetical protein
MLSVAAIDWRDPVLPAARYYLRANGDESQPDEVEAEEQEDEDADEPPFDPES